MDSSWVEKKWKLSVSGREETANGDRQDGHSKRIRRNLKIVDVAAGID